MIAGEWQKSSFCNGASSCVEVARLPDGGVLMRDGKDPDGPVHRFTRSEWDAFVAGVKDGEFDLVVLASDATGAARASGMPVAFVKPPQVSR